MTTSLPPPLHDIAGSTHLIHTPLPPHYHLLCRTSRDLPISFTHHLHVINASLPPHYHLLCRTSRDLPISFTHHFHLITTSLPPHFQIFAAPSHTIHTPLTPHYHLITTSLPPQVGQPLRPAVLPRAGVPRRRQADTHARQHTYSHLNWSRSASPRNWCACYRELQ